MNERTGTGPTPRSDGERSLFHHVDQLEVALRRIACWPRFETEGDMARAAVTFRQIASDALATIPEESAQPSRCPSCGAKRGGLKIVGGRCIFCAD